MHAVRKRPPWSSPTRLAHGCCWPHPRRDPAMAGAPWQHRASTMFQRKRSVSFGGYGWWVPFFSLPALLLGAWGCARSFFFSCCGFKGGRTVALRHGALAAEPFALPRASRSAWESGQTFFPPRRALWEPCGCQVGARGGLPWACRLQEGPVVPSPPHCRGPAAHSSSARAAKLTAAFSTSRRGPTWSMARSRCHWHLPELSPLCARQSTAAAACTPGSEGLFTSRVPALRDVLICRGTV